MNHMYICIKPSTFFHLALSNATAQISLFLEISYMILMTYHLRYHESNSMNFLVAGYSFLMNYFHYK
jgi:hypothetical protein